MTQRRLVCTAQYGAFLMSILAVTARLVESAKALFPPSERDQAGEAYFELAQDFLRIGKNKLDIRHILALYRTSFSAISVFPHTDLLLTRAHRPCLICRRSHRFCKLVLPTRPAQRRSLICFFTGAVSGFVAEAVGLAFTTGLHRSTREFNMDPVTLQVRSAFPCKT